MKRKSLGAILLLLLAGTGYGSAFIANRVAAESGLPVTAYMFWISVLGALVLLTAALILRLKVPWNIKSLAHFPVSATFGMLIPFGVLYSIATKLPAGVLTLTFTLAPAFTYLFAYVCRIENFRWSSIAAILFGFTGVMLIVLPDTSLPEPEAAPWLLLALLAPVAASVNNLVVATLRPPELDSLMLAGTVLLAASIIMLPLMLVVEGPTFFWQYGYKASIGVIWSATVQAIGYFALYEVIRQVGPVFFSQIAYIVVFAGTVWAYFFFGEVPSSWVWGAIAFLLVSLILANRKHRSTATV